MEHTLIAISMIEINDFSLFFLSIWKSVPGAEGFRKRCRETLCNEGAKESNYCAKEEDHRTHQDRTPSPGGSPSESFPRHPSLCLPNRCQASSHSR